jgi:hypothetical protein
MAGISINPNGASDKLVMYLEGGPVCVDATTCAQTGAPIADTRKFSGDTGGAVWDVFQRSKASNPFRDWNFVWVPHCTDDYHSGDAADVAVPGVPGLQQIVGWRNMGYFLRRLAPTFPRLSQVVLSGCSSGGQGGQANFPQVQRAFGRVPVTLLADSGPPVAPSETSGIQAAMLGFWGADRSMQKECAGACRDPATFFTDYTRWLVGAYPARAFGFSAFYDDPVEQGEFGITAAEWAAHLDAVRGILASAPSKTGTFFAPLHRHCMLYGGQTESVVVGGVTFADWISGVAAGAPTTVGP